MEDETANVEGGSQKLFADAGSQDVDGQETAIKDVDGEQSGSQTTEDRQDTDAVIREDIHAAANSQNHETDGAGGDKRFGGEGANFGVLSDKLTGGGSSSGGAELGLQHRVQELLVRPADAPSCTPKDMNSHPFFAKSPPRAQDLSHRHCEGNVFQLKDWFDQPPPPCTEKTYKQRLESILGTIEAVKEFMERAKVLIGGKGPLGLFGEI